MSFDTQIVAGKVVVDSAVLAVGNNCVHLDPGCCFMLLQKRRHHMRFVDATGCRFACGNDLVLAVNRPMHLIGKLRFAAVDYGCIRVGAGNIAVVLLLIVLRSFAVVVLFGQPGFQLLVVLVKPASQTLCVDDRIVRGIAIDQTGINKDLAAVNQSGLDALQNDSLKKALKNGSAPFLPGFG